jgi:hypothetical protein
MSVLLSCLLWHVFTTWYRSEMSLGTIICLFICNSWSMSFVIMIHDLVDIGYKYLLSLCEGFLSKSNNQTVRSSNTGSWIGAKSHWVFALAEICLKIYVSHILTYWLRTHPCRVESILDVKYSLFYLAMIWMSYQWI